MPAARPDSIHRDNAAAVRAKLILPGANIPATADAERHLFERGVIDVPDFIANAGGVVCASAEYHDVPARPAAIELARERVVDAGRYRR